MVNISVLSMFQMGITKETATMETYLMVFVVSSLVPECKQTPHNKEPIDVRHKASMQEH